MAALGAFLAGLGAIGILASLIMWMLRRKDARVAFRNSFLVMLLGGFLQVLGDSGNTQTAPNTPPTQTTQPSTPAQATPAKPKEAPKPALELLEATSKVEEYGRYIVGKIRNNTAHTYRYVQIQINLYDKAGNLVGSTMDNVNNLEPGAIWRFKAPILEESAARYKIVDISGF